MSNIGSRIRKIIVAATILMATVGCTDATPAPSADNGSTSTPPPIPGFPELSTFKEADHNTFYMLNKPQAQGFWFSTTDGMTCGNNAYPDAKFETLSCTGPRPDKGPGLWSVTVDANGGGPATAEQLFPGPTNTPASEPRPPVLPVGKKITASKGVSVCAVSADSITACRLGNHGFVLTAHNTTLF